jgi:hypothetical protein
VGKTVLLKAFTEMTRRAGWLVVQAEAQREKARAAVPKKKKRNETSSVICSRRSALQSSST